MRDFLHVSFFLGDDEGEAARRLLRQCDLLEIAESSHVNRDSWRSRDLHHGVILRLPIDDARIHYLVHLLRERGCDPFTRVDREHSTRELDSASWLVLRVGTAGLYGGVDLDQQYDFSDACPMCGAGSKLVPPLRAELRRMGKKDLDRVWYEGHLIATRRIAEGLAGLTGLDPTPVGSRRRKVDDRYSWLRITGMLPPMSSHSYRIYRPCGECHRSGHYANVAAAEAVCYESVFDHVTDFNLTWEYFGDWEQRRQPKHLRPIGPGQGIVVSQRARRRLQVLRVRRLFWVPVEVG